MSKYMVRIGEMVIFNVPVEADTEDEAWDMAYDKIGIDELPYLYATADVGFESSIKEIE